ncbi:hypothetical protein HPB51_026844 [Rhipicephalus microplus]|uniref:CCHC-type domain-containing protein n=1 Tax=Rhipicephalus microplus TaxID=6941 RepID=A0A9J6D1V6_RHIMP|nr:hypothetical protein HPB51_026844 [Rhipicephalus microplus]
MRQGRRSIVSKVLRASKMPRLPRDDIKVIIRPRDGLNTRSTCGASLDKAIRNRAGVGDDEMITICLNPMQNILVISTPEESTATKIAKMKVLTINGKRYKTNAYVSAPENMTKGIIRNVPLNYNQDQLVEALVNTRNPSLMYAKRLGSTTNVILLYEGNRVPSWVYFNSVMIRVSLYRKQIDFCKECGRLGHRPDVCPRPYIKLCPICGLKNPINGHECTPQCRICGEAHPTADRMCQAKYKVLHIVKQRRWKARYRDFQERTPSPSDSNAGAVEGDRPSCSRSRTRSQQVMGPSTRSGSPSPVKRWSKSRSTSRSHSRSRSRSENRHHPQQDIGGATPGGKQKGPRNITWRDIVTGTKADSAQGHPLSGRPRSAADLGLAARMENMEKENRELRQELAKARRRNEKSTRKIEELQQTLNEILQRMGGHPEETPSSGASSSHGDADERDTTSAVGDGATDIGCGGEYEGPAAVGF